MESYELLTGVGDLYIAPVGTAYPSLTLATPAAPWRALGETQDGVKLTIGKSVEQIRVDQRHGPVKAILPESDATVETKLAIGTLENLADILGNTVTDTPAGVGTIGTRALGLYPNSEMQEFAFLFRGKSPYGDFPGQYQLPRGYFDGDVEIEHKKDGNVAFPISFKCLEDLDASSEALRYGQALYQDAAALP